MMWLHSVLRLADSRHDMEQLDAVCRLFGALEGANVVAANVFAEAIVTDVDCLRAWTRAVLRERLSPATRSLLEESMPGLCDRLDYEGFVRGCFEWFERRQESNPKYAEYLAEKGIWDDMATADMHGRTLGALLRHIDRCFGESPMREGAVLCRTISDSKGMAFDHVYLIGLTEGELPDAKAIRKGDANGERRVCFAAMTRTRKTLTLTCPRHTSGSAREPSRFLAGIGSDLGRPPRSIKWWFRYEGIGRLA